MTTVSENFPSTTGIYSTGGYNFVCKNGIERNRYSSGANRPKGAYATKYWSFVNSTIRYRTRAGKTTTWVVHKQKIRKYRELIKGSAAFAEPHPYTRSSYKAVYSPYLASWSGGSSYSNPNALWSFSDLKAWGANDEIVLINKLRAKLQGSGFDPSVFVAELPQALEMILNAATRIGKAYRSVRKGRSIDAWNHLTESKPYKKFGITQSSSWLELQYGWLPLLSDAKDGAEYLAHHLSSDIPRPVKYRVSRRINSTHAPPSSPGSEGFAKADHFIRKSIIATVTEKDRVALGNIVDPLTVIWEKLPYSFVVDWFIPIGAYLSARGLATRLNGNFVVSTMEKRVGRSWLRNNQANGGTRYGPGTLDIDVVSFSRTITATLDVKLPTVKPLAKIASWAHAANAVALLTQKFRS